VPTPVTIVGAGARLEGNVVSAGSLRIDGQVKGQINADGDVTLAPQSQVEADIRAQNVSVAGRFKGDVNVDGDLTIDAGAKITGSVRASTVTIGGELEGNIEAAHGRTSCHRSSGRDDRAHRGGPGDVVAPPELPRRQHERIPPAVLADEAPSGRKY